jgi:hypothetical protein
MGILPMLGAIAFEKNFACTARLRPANESFSQRLLAEH